MRHTGLLQDPAFTEKWIRPAELRSPWAFFMFTKSNALRSLICSIKKARLAKRDRLYHLVGHTGFEPVTSTLSR